MNPILPEVNWGPPATTPPADTCPIFRTSFAVAQAADRQLTAAAQALFRNVSIELAGLAAQRGPISLPAGSMLAAALKAIRRTREPEQHVIEQLRQIEEGGR